MVRPLTSASAPPAAWRRRSSNASSAGSTTTACGRGGELQQRAIDVEKQAPGIGRQRHRVYRRRIVSPRVCIIRASIRSDAARGLTIFVS